MLAHVLSDRRFEESEFKKWGVRKGTTLGQYKIAHVINQGSYGAVFEAIDKSGNVFAVKLFDTEEPEIGQCGDGDILLAQQLALMKQDHPYGAQFVSCPVDEIILRDTAGRSGVNRDVAIVYEKAQMTLLTFLELIKITPFKGLSQAMLFKMVLGQMVLGLVFLEKGQIAHGDLARANVFVHILLEVNLDTDGNERWDIKKLTL
eukprot:Selendium_serpulae@DN11349_c0_g1_i1.p1